MPTDYIYLNIIRHIINNILLLSYLRVRENVFHNLSLSYLLTKVNGTSLADIARWVHFVNRFGWSLKINAAILIGRKNLPELAIAHDKDTSLTA